MQLSLCDKEGPNIVTGQELLSRTAEAVQDSTAPTRTLRWNNTFQLLSLLQGVQSQCYLQLAQKHLPAVKPQMDTDSFKSLSCSFWTL